MMKRLREKVEGYYVVKYGPPYHEEYGGCLYEECQIRRCDMSFIRQLLREGGDPRLGNPEDYHNTPMHYAARYSKLGLCKLLERAGASASKCNDLGQTALSVACTFGAPAPLRKTHLKMIAWLVEHCDLNHVDKGGNTALELATARDDIEAVSFLLRRGATVSRHRRYLSIAGPTTENVIASKKKLQGLLRAKAQKEDEEKQRRDLKRREKEWDSRIERNQENRRASVKASIQKRQTKRQNTPLPLLKSPRRRGDLEASKTRHGIWRKKNNDSWVFVETTQTEVPRDTLEDAEALLRDECGLRYKFDLQRRWQSMTGLQVNDNHPIMRIT